MTLKQVKLQCLEKNITISELARRLKISRTWLYNRIEKNDPKTMQDLEKIFNSIVVK